MFYIFTLVIALHASLSCSAVYCIDAYVTVFYEQINDDDDGECTFSWLQCEVVVCLQLRSMDVKLLTLSDSF